MGETLREKIDPNVEIRDYLADYFRENQVEERDRREIKQRLMLGENARPVPENFRLIEDVVSFTETGSWNPGTLLISDDLTIFNSRFDDGDGIVLHFSFFIRLRGTVNSRQTFLPLYFNPKDADSIPFATLRFGFKGGGDHRLLNRDGYLFWSSPFAKDGVEINLYLPENSDGVAANDFCFFGETYLLKSEDGSLVDLDFNFDFNLESDVFPQDYTWEQLDLVGPSYGLGAESFRIYGSKRVPAFEYGLVESVDEAIDAIQMGRELKASGQLAITFFELRGEKDPYTGLAHTVFVFRCWGSPESDARRLWMIVDEALHNKFNVDFGGLYVYSSLRRDMPELDLQDELTHLNAFNFFSAYDLVYWEYNDGQ